MSPLMGENEINTDALWRYSDTSETFINAKVRLLEGKNSLVKLPGKTELNSQLFFHPPFILYPPIFHSLSPILHSLCFLHLYSNSSIFNSSSNLHHSSLLHPTPIFILHSFFLLRPPPIIFILHSFFSLRPPPIIFILFYFQFSILYLYLLSSILHSLFHPPSSTLVPPSLIYHSPPFILHFPSSIPHLSSIHSSNSITSCSMSHSSSDSSSSILPTPQSSFFTVHPSSFILFNPLSIFNSPSYTITPPTITPLSIIRSSITPSLFLF